MINEIADKNRRARRSLFGLATVLFFIGLAYTIVTGIQHDYVLQSQMLAIILRGDDPWSMVSNTYGPVFPTILAQLFALHPLAPKVLFYLSWQALQFALMFKVRKRIDLMLTVLGLFSFPLFWVEVAKWGHMESTMAMLTVASIALTRRNKDFSAGALLALATSIKYIPIVVLPFLAIHRGKIRWKLALSFVLTTALLFGYCYTQWGFSFLKTFTHAASTESTHMSIFRFLRGIYSPLKLFGIENVDFLSLPCMALGGGFVFLLYLLGRISQVRAITAGLLIALTFYHVGYAQYFTNYFGVFFYYFAVRNLGESKERLIDQLPAFWPLLFVAFFQCTHAYEIELFARYGFSEWFGIIGIFLYLNTFIWLLKGRKGQTIQT